VPADYWLCLVTPASSPASGTVADWGYKIDFYKDVE